MLEKKQRIKVIKNANKINTKATRNLLVLFTRECAKILSVELTCIWQRSEMIFKQVDHKNLIRARSVYRDFLTDFPVSNPGLLYF